MTRSARRIQLTPGYILHHRPYRDTSRILEVLTREHGRLSLFARGVRGPKAKLASVLQPFQMLLFSWNGRGEAAQLTGAESAHAGPPLPSSCLMAAFYLNELLLKLTTRHDPLPLLFDTYHDTIEGLRQGESLEPRLRIFEKRLLEALGYGLELSAEAQTGKRVEPNAYYHFRPEQGLVATVAQAAGALAGTSLIGLASEHLAGERELEDAKRLLQAALAQCLEGRPLATRMVARAVARRESLT
ncbi:MAG TPA: DNA repair protein RecO [Steroidobacteraceae bacterium]|nr:DNA repair protein RecO [Steroidobacteraceae bacterium]